MDGFRRRKRKASKNSQRIRSSEKLNKKKKKHVPKDVEHEETEDLFDENVQDVGYEDLIQRIKNKRREEAIINRSQTTFGNARKKRKLEDDDDIRISINTTGNAAPHDGSDNRATMKINVKERYKREDGDIIFQDGQELYQGMNKYTNKAGHQDAEGVNKTSRIGPARAPADHLPTCIFDYQPDICKDYKETGYCGYGDSCKFLHDRTDYKAGWQIERDWEIAQKKREDRLLGKPVSDDESDYEIKSDEELPFACYICRKTFEEPVKTYCGHFFCRACALKSYRKTPGCKVCGENTEGVFMAATEIKEKMKKQVKSEKVDNSEEGN